MNIWKTIREEEPRKFENVLILTRGNRIVQAFWNPEDRNFYRRIGLVKPISYKRWCYEEDLVNQALEEINNVSKKKFLTISII